MREQRAARSAAPPWTRSGRSTRAASARPASGGLRVSAPSCYTRRPFNLPAAQRGNALGGSLNREDKILFGASGKLEGFRDLCVPLQSQNHAPPQIITPCKFPVDLLLYLCITVSNARCLQIVLFISLQSNAVCCMLT